MAAVQQFSYHVNGPTLPFVAFGIGQNNPNGGASAANFSNIGVAQDGADVMIQPAVHGIHDDGGGGMDGQPIEYIYLNAIATIRFRLVPYGGVFLNSLRSSAMVTSTDGVSAYPGALYGGNNSLVSLYLPNSAGEVDGGWLFPACLVVRPGDVRVWTKETTPELEFRAFIYLPPTVATIGNLPLYTRSAPA